MMGRGANDSSDSDEEISDIPKNARFFAEKSMVSTMFSLKSIFRPVSSIKMSLTVTFDAKNVGYRNCPQYNKDPYRNFSISRVAPSIRPVAGIWRPIPYPYMSKHAGCDHWRKLWPTQQGAYDYIMPKVAWNIAVARRSAISTSLETDAGAGTLSKQWPAVTMGERKLTCGLCFFLPSNHYKLVLCANATSAQACERGLNKEGE
jgi:hypothetical protein